MKIVTLRLSLTRCYLIPVGRRYLMVDSGFEADWDLLLRRLGEAGVDLSDISTLALTHHDADHCGLINRIVEAQPSIRVLMSRSAKPLLAGGVNDCRHGRHFLNLAVSLAMRLPLKRAKVWLETGRWLSGPDRSEFPPYVARPVDMLVSAETPLRDLGLDLDGRIVPTPGHTADSISVVLANGDAFVGDAAANWLHWLGARYRAPALEDLEIYYRSWNALIAGGAQRIFPAHGEPFAVARLRENLPRRAAA